MKYADREGNRWEKEDGQDRLTEKIVWLCRRKRTDAGIDSSGGIQMFRLAAFHQTLQFGSKIYCEEQRY